MKTILSLSVLLLLHLVAFGATNAMPRVPGPRAAALGAEFQKTHDEATKRAWYQALEDEKWDFKTRARSTPDARGVYKFNRESKLVCLVLKKTDKPGDSWDESLGEDGTLHVEWTRKANGGIDYKYTAPTNWDVFVSAYPGAVTRYGVKVMKSRFGEDKMPEVKLPEGWRIVPGDAYSGVNVREAFLTFEKDGLRLPPPAVELVWPGVGVRTVHGASNVVTTATGATFVPSARKPPTAFGTSLPREGAISVSLPHHIKGMQAGPHRDVPYPENEIKAMYNFIFALREGFRFLGFDKRDPKDGSLVLCGFESNYPNGHTDFPAHFHIIHSGVDGTQVHHFYMAPDTGCITWDCYQDMSNVMDVWDVVWKYYPNDAFAMYDVHANVSYRVKMLAEGKGFEIALPDNSRAFRVCGDRPCDALDVYTRGRGSPAASEWKKVKTISVHDDPVAGILHVPDGDVAYDPDTGARRADAYIPEPQPVKGGIEVTALYYPGTEHMPEWDMVKQVTPEVKPLLGWYDEHDPENIDWQIKWATEHGISSFCVCWYWNKGVQRLDHWVKAFYQARFRRHLKWYVMYANHNQPGSHSTADQIAVTKFWIENYFKTPEYYTIDGKPVVVYCTPSLLDNDFIAEAKAKGETLQRGEGIRRALDISEKMAKEAGLPGIYWVDMRWLRNPGEWSFDPKVYAVTQKARFDAMMSYNLGGTTPCGMAPEFRTEEDRPRWSRYDLQVECAKKLAEKADFLPGIPFWPTVPTGYDDVSRAFQRAWTVHSVTPEKFRAACEAVKAACVRKGVKRVVIAPINEWQEGSIAEPNEKFGFALYDAIRDVFCTKPATGWPKNVTPQELGRPLREYPPMQFAKVQQWEFENSTEGWYRQPFGCPVVLAADGAITFVTTRDDLFNIRQRMEPFDAKKYKTFKVCMRIKPNAVIKLGGRKVEDISMRLKWGTVDEPIIGNLHAVEFEKMVGSARVIPDGEWHEYSLTLDKFPSWRGAVNELWFEAVNVRAANVEIDWMRFE